MAGVVLNVGMIAGTAGEGCGPAARSSFDGGGGSMP